MGNSTKKHLKNWNALIDSLIRIDGPESTADFLEEQIKGLKKVILLGTGLIITADLPFAMALLREHSTNEKIITGTVAAIVSMPFLRYTIEDIKELRNNYTRLSVLKRE
jgi:hypothetical protein